MFRKAISVIFLFSVCLNVHSLPAPQHVTASVGGQELSGRFFLPNTNIFQGLGGSGLFQNMLRPLFQGGNLFGGNNGYQLGSFFGGNNNGYQGSSLFGGNNNGFQGGSLFGGNNNGFQGGSLFGGNNNGFQGGSGNGRPGFASNLGQFASGFFEGFQSRPTVTGAQSTSSSAVIPPASVGFQAVPGTGFQSAPNTGKGSSGSRGGSLFSGFTPQTESGFLPGLISVVAPFFGRYEPNNNNNRVLFGK